MTVAIVQSASTPSTASATTTVTFTSTPTPGNVLVFICGAHAATTITGPAAVTSFMSLSGNTNRLTGFYRVAQAGDATAWSFTNADSFVSVVGVELSGVDLATPIDNTPAGVNSAQSPITAPTVTATRTGGVALAAVNTDSGQTTYTVTGTGWSLLRLAGGASNWHSSGVASRSGLDTTATTGATFTYATASTALATTVMLRAASAPLAPTPSDVAAVTDQVSVTTSWSAAAHLAAPVDTAAAADTAVRETPGLGAPSGLTVTPVSTSRLDLSWSAVAGASGYDIERNGTVIVTDHPTTSYSDTGLSPAVSYTYRVRTVA